MQSNRLLLKIKLSYPGQRVDHGTQYLTRYMTGAEHDEIYSSLVKHNVIQPFSMDCVDGAHPKSRKYVFLSQNHSCLHFFLQ